MRNTTFTLLVLAFTGCTPTTASPDTGTPALDAPQQDAREPRDTPRAPDAAGCVDISGAWVWSGTCTTGELVLPDGCISQDGCNIRLIESTAQGAEEALAASITGVVVGNIATLEAAGTTYTYVFNGDTASWTASPGSCSATGARFTFPGASSYCCDVSSASSCGAGQRCQVFGHPSQEVFTRSTACVPAGTIALGASCTRSMMGRVGADECAAGLSCTNINSAMGADRQCTTLCVDSSDCPTNQRCWSFAAAPRAGACANTCTIGGTDCPMGTTCRTSLSWADGAGAPVVDTACTAVGTTPAGGACTDMIDCIANHDCFFDPAVGPTTSQCRQVCDPTHMCPSGQTCLVRRGNAAGAGTCFPTP